MSNVLTQTIVYLLLLFIGYGFKKVGIFKVEDSDFLKSVILYITMPAAAVNGLKDLELQTSFLWCFLIGFATCSLLMAVGMFVSRKSDASGKLLYLFSFNSFNVGNFAIPFLTGLISANGFAAICLFDISVAIFLYGVDYSVAESIKGEGGRILSETPPEKAVLLAYHGCVSDHDPSGSAFDPAPCADLETCGSGGKCKCISGHAQHRDPV